MNKSPARKLTLVIGLVFLCLAHGIAAQTLVVQVPRNNTQALIAAIEEAAQRPGTESTEIIIGGTYRFDDSQLATLIQSDVTIRGGNRAAVLTADDNRAPYLEVDRGGSLTLVNLEFADIEMNGDLIRNSGSLTLDRVQFTRVQAHPFCFRFGCSNMGRLVLNQETGSVLMEQVSVIDSGANGPAYFNPGAMLLNYGEATIRNFQLYLPDGLVAAPIWNLGSLRIVNSTFAAFNGGPDREFISGLFGEDLPYTEFSNSIVSGFDAGWCQYVTSTGHNLIDNPDCVLDGDGDLTGVDANLIWAPVTADWSPTRTELLTRALVPLADSLAVDSGSIEACNEGSLLAAVRISEDGDGDGLSRCDRGAVERVPSTVTQGGINGLYFNPDADGHYLYIADTGGPVMVMWTTFDANGDPAWIFGLADRIRPNGRVKAEAYINRNGRVGLDGRLRSAESQPWGTLDVRMNSCNSGRLIYESGQPGFGSGTFEFQRLSEVDQIGCVNDR
ncbi:MAG TPA: hypothetical protein VJ984_04600 [Xanthomonadales bacterium]|nr:hypothetical protein [Xanthomonadales bacterium]